MTARILHLFEKLYGVHVCKYCGVVRGTERSAWCDPRMVTP